MGGERAATTRQRLSGQICAFCKSYLKPPYPGHERTCEKCAPRRRVLMSFVERPEGWLVNFLDKDCRTPIGDVRTFRSDEVLRLAVERGAGLTDLEARHMFNLAIEKRRGAVWLNLTAAQYGSLCNPRTRKPPQPQR